MLCFLALGLTPAIGQDTLTITSCTAFWKTGAPVADAVITVGVEAPGVPPAAIFFGQADCASFEEPLPLAYPPGTTFSFTAAKDGDDLNGVTILDLIAISNHILGLQPLSLYGMLAADANRSNGITTFDVVEVRKLVLGIYTEFPNNTSWRFFPETCDFPNPQNPFANSSCPDLDVDELPAWDGDTLHLIGVKTGDVDGDANPAGLYGGPVFLDSITLLLPDLQLQAGVPATVAVTFDGPQELSGLQVEFHFDADKLQVSDVFGTPFFNTGAYGVFSGILTAAGISNLTPMQPGDTLMKFQLTANQDIVLSDEFGLGDSLLSPLAIGGVINPQALKVKSEFYPSLVPAGTPNIAGKIGPASPNPFTDRAFIALELERPETVRLEVFDLTGRRRHILENLFASGAHRLEIPAEAVASGSIGIYRLQVGGRVETGKVGRQ